MITVRRTQLMRRRIQPVVVVMWGFQEEVMMIVIVILVAIFAQRFSRVRVARGMMMRRRRRMRRAGEIRRHGVVMGSRWRQHVTRTAAALGVMLIAVREVMMMMMLLRVR